MTFHCNTFSLVWSRDKVENMEKTGKEITKVELNLSHAEMMALSFALAHRELRLDDILQSCLGRSGDSDFCDMYRKELTALRAVMSQFSKF